MLVRFAGLVTVFILAGCGVEPKTVQSQATSDQPRLVSPSSRRYETDRGVFLVDIPSNYVSVKEHSPAYFDVFQQAMPALRIVDVYITKDDLEHSRTPGLQREGQLVQLQIFPPDEPEIGNAEWAQLQEILPAMMSGGELRQVINLSARETLDRSRQMPGQTSLADLRVGDVTVFHRDAESIRWATITELTTANQKPAQVIQISAARRIGPYVYLVQTALRKRDSGDELKAIASANSWVERITTQPN